jgi:hypothetical protein
VPRWRWRRVRCARPCHIVARAREVAAITGALGKGSGGAPDDARRSGQCIAARRSRYRCCRAGLGGVVAGRRRHLRNRPRRRDVVAWSRQRARWRTIARRIRPRLTQNWSRRPGWRVGTRRHRSAGRGAVSGVGARWRRRARGLGREVLIRARRAGYWLCSTGAEHAGRARNIHGAEACGRHRAGISRRARVALVLVSGAGVGIVGAVRAGVGIVGVAAWAEIPPRTGRRLARSLLRDRPKRRCRRCDRTGLQLAGLRLCGRQHQQQRPEGQ